MVENRKRVEVGSLAPLDEKQAEAQAASSQAVLIAARSSSTSTMGTSPAVMTTGTLRLEPWMTALPMAVLTELATSVYPDLTAAAARLPAISSTLLMSATIAVPVALQSRSKVGAVVPTRPAGSGAHVESPILAESGKSVIPVGTAPSDCSDSSRLCCSSDLMPACAPSMSDCWMSGSTV